MIRTALILLLTTAAACGNDDSDSKNVENAFRMDPSLKPGAPLSLSGELVPAAGCSAVESHIKSNLINSLRREYEHMVDNYEYIYRPGIEMEDQAAPTAAGDGADDSAAEKSGAAGPTDFTTTNQQVAGVDESDFVKNTGTHIFSIRGRQVFIVKSWPADAMKVVAKIDLDDKPLEMILSGDGRTLIVAAMPQAKAMAAPSTQASSESDSASAEKDAADSTFLPDDQSIPSFSHNATRLTYIDISDLARPKMKGSHLFPGAFKTMRRIDDSVRLVLGGMINNPAAVRYYGSGVDFKQAESKKEFQNQLKALYAENVAAIEGTELADFMTPAAGEILVEPAGMVGGGDNDCSSVYLPTAPTELGLTSIASVALNSADLAKSQASLTSILADGNIVYASKDSLYLANTYWRWWTDRGEPGDLTYSYIHQFDLSDKDSTGYMGSGRVPGVMKDQFALDEYSGHLRAAVTVTEEISAPEDNSFPEVKTYNQVLVLRNVENTLKIVGQTKQLAEGEQIFSTRFSGERGFVVTFRQVDPLFTLDLSDPENPEVLGELKIPGFSDYMQMIDENTILTVGYEDWRLKISLFDVSNMNSPKETDSLILDEYSWAYSSANHDHKAFTYYAQKGLLAIPVSGYHDNANQADLGSSYVSELAIFTIKPESGISRKGVVSMSDVSSNPAKQDRDWFENFLTVQRSIFADDFVYAVADGGIKAANLGTLETTESKVSLPCDEACYQYSYCY